MIFNAANQFSRIRFGYNPLGILHCFSTCLLSTLGRDFIKFLLISFAKLAAAPEWSPEQIGQGLPWLGIAQNDGAEGLLNPIATRTMHEN